MRTYAFIDAANLFYGGEKSLGWKIDYQKLLFYLGEKYKVSQAYYFGGVDIHDFPYNYQTSDTVALEDLDIYLSELQRKQIEPLKELQRVRFYSKLDEFGYNLFLKPVKFYHQPDGRIERKANCDVDMAFHLMKQKENFDRVIVLSGDGDFLPVLKYLREIKKSVIIMARGPRTAKEIRQFAGTDFKDFEYLETRIAMR